MKLGYRFLRRQFRRTPSPTSSSRIAIPPSRLMTSARLFNASTVETPLTLLRICFLTDSISDGWTVISIVSEEQELSIHRTVPAPITP